MFERLTEKGCKFLTPANASKNELLDEIKRHQKYYDRLAAYEDSGLSPEEVQKLKKSDASKEQCTIDQHGEIHRLRDELKRYKQAEQEGRLYNLPLKPGDTIYRPEALQFCWVITKVEIYEDEIVFIDDSDNIFRPDEFGKTVFLTREEAEAALRKEQEK